MNKKHFVGALELKSMDDNGQFSGYGAVFGNRDQDGDVIVRGAFTNQLANSKPSDIKMLWQHDTRCPIGVYDEIYEDDNGLFVKGRLLVGQVEKATECYALLKAGAIQGLSVGFTINQDGAKYAQDGNRYLSDLRLWEISIVTFPANMQANVDNVKSITNIKEFERFLRDAGFSRSEATKIASRGYKSVQCDAGQDDLVELRKKLNELNQIIKG